MVSSDYKIWAIVMSVITGVLAIALTVLITVCIMTANNAKPTETTSQNSQPPEYKPGEVKIDDLDGTKLITSAQLATGEIPDHYTGNKNAKVVVIEYEDFACSHCQALAETAGQIHDDYGDKVLFIHRSYSLGYPNSDRTLMAAEAAYQLGGQTAYWKMMKLLYQDTRWTGNEVFGSMNVLTGFAKQIGLDEDEFRDAMSEPAVSNKIARDKELGTNAGVVGTPTWFVNGIKVTPQDADIRAALDVAL